MFQDRRGINEESDRIALHTRESEEIDSDDGTIISFHGVDYHVEPSKILTHLPIPLVKRSKQQILHNLCGVFKPGMSAILGPTGSGKSSLLDILADRKSRRSVTGHVLIDGRRRTSNFRYRVGYVTQDDIVSGALTVRENLTFSANIRLPQDTSLAMRINIVNDVIEQLGLTKCADTKVGDEYQRGISGGERRRTNIGLELVLSPRILFLDEPTTGLDSSTARTVMKYLHKLSRKNHTIILSIHQPQYSIFKLFDRIYLLAAGRCIYHGSSLDMLPYFSSIGYSCEEHDNPADFILDVCQGDVRSNTSTDQLDVKSLTGQNQLISHLNQNFVNSTLYTSMEYDVSEQVQLAKQMPRKNVVHVQNSRLFEFLHLSQRTLRSTFRNPALLVMQIGFPVFLALLIGMIFWKIDHSIDSGKKNRLGAIYFIVANQVFGNLSALEIFLNERVLFVHEHSSGYYRISTYFFSKLFCDLLPMRTIPSILFSVIVYFLVGFQAVASKFFLFFVGIFMTVICASALCFFVSASIQSFSMGNLLAATFCTLTALYAGLFVDITTITAVLGWIQWLSIFRYAYNFFAINEFTGLKLDSESGNVSMKIPGETVLTQEKIDHLTSWDFWKNFTALGGMTLIFLTLAYIQLIRMKKTK